MLLTTFHTKRLLHTKPYGSNNSYDR